MTKQEKHELDNSVLTLYRKENRIKEAVKNGCDLKNIINDIKTTNNLPSVLKSRGDLKSKPIYLINRKNYETDILERTFESEGTSKVKDKKYTRFSLEHAQKFYLYEHYTKNQKVLLDLGYIVAYELPFFKNRMGGAVDLVAYDFENNTINMIELKKCEMFSDNKDCKESLERAILEIETYEKFMNKVIECINCKKILCSEIRERMKKFYNFEEVEFENIEKSIKIKKNLLIPERLLSNGIKITEADIPNDIDIYTIKLVDKEFSMYDKIGESAQRDKLIFDIKNIKKYSIGRN